MFLFLQAALVIAQASEDKPKNDVKVSKITKLGDVIPKAVELSARTATKGSTDSKLTTNAKPDSKDIAQLEQPLKTSDLDDRTSRQLQDYKGQSQNEVVVDIEDDEKKQYYETNYDTSKYLTLNGD